MLKTTELNEFYETIEFERAPFDDQMGNLARVLRSRGGNVPAGYTVTLESVPESDRDDNGLPWFRAVLVPVAEPEPAAEVSS